MRISSVNRNIYANKLYGIQSSRNAVLQEKLQFPDITNKHQNNNLVQLPLNTLKANFCPSFGKYRKVADVYLKDKETGESVKASLQREYVGDFVSFKLMHRNEEAGYLDMDCGAVFPENSYVLPEIDNVIPRVCHVRSLLGDKYHGIGTALINAAVNESRKAGEKGYLWLQSEKGYAHSLSRYRRGENPIPFYYKLGFRAIDKNTDKFIKFCLEKSKYSELPDTAILLLTPEAVSKNTKYFPKQD